MSNEADADVVRGLKLCGDPLSLSRETDFYFYFPVSLAAKLAAEEFRALGFEVEVKSCDDGKFLCLAKKNLVPSLSRMTGLRPKLERIAKRHSGTYDGWETCIMGAEGPVDSLESPQGIRVIVAALRESGVNVGSDDLKRVMDGISQFSGFRLPTSSASH